MPDILLINLLPRALTSFLKVRPELNLNPWRCKATVLTTMPPCRPKLVHQVYTDSLKGLSASYLVVGNSVEESLTTRLKNCEP